MEQERREKDGRRAWNFASVLPAGSRIQILLFWNSARVFLVHSVVGKRHSSHASRPGRMQVKRLQKTRTRIFQGNKGKSINQPRFPSSRRFPPSSRIQQRHLLAVFGRCLQSRIVERLQMEKSQRFSSKRSSERASCLQSTTLFEIDLDDT